MTNAVQEIQTEEADPPAQEESKQPLKYGEENVENAKKLAKKLSSEYLSKGMTNSARLKQSEPPKKIPSRKTLTKNDAELAHLLVTKSNRTVDSGQWTWRKSRRVPRGGRASKVDQTKAPRTHETSRPGIRSSKIQNSSFFMPQ